MKTLNVSITLRDDALETKHRVENAIARALQETGVAKLNGTHWVEPRNLYRLKKGERK